VKLVARPVTLRQAIQFVRDHHRHAKAPQGGKFAIAAMNGNDLVGVAIVGRPVSRHFDNGTTAEITRLCSDGSRNVCSFLYRRAFQAASAMGYTRVITYTMEAESGASLRAAGADCLGKAGGGSWDKPGRRRLDAPEPAQRVLWELS